MTYKGSCFSVFPVWTTVTLGSFIFQYGVSTPRPQAPDCLELYPELVGWIDGRGPAPLPELDSWSSPLTTNHPCLNGINAPPVWDSSTYQTDASSRPNRYFVPSTTTNAPDAGQTAPTMELALPHSSRTSSSGTNDSTTGFTVSLLKPRPTQGPTVILSRIETHVYLDIVIPSRSWNAIQLPLTKSVTSDDSSNIGEDIKPLQLVITVRGATTRQECNRVCQQCKKRMGNKIGSSSLIDFHGPSNILTSVRGTIQFHFTFSCYSRHHQKEDEKYVYVAVAQ